jgi:hypothetical protein
MNLSSNHIQHHKELVTALYQYCCVELPFCSEQAEQSDLELLDSLKLLSETEQLDDEYNFQGQALICRMITHYPHITPSINRDLLWYFGGDCLHYLSDEEISLYQQVDELLFQAQNEGQPLDINTAKTRVFKPH